MADRDAGLGDQAKVGIVLRDGAQHLGAGGQALDHDDAGIVGPVMNEQVGVLARICLVSGFQNDLGCGGPARLDVGERPGAVG